VGVCDRGDLLAVAVGRKELDEVGGLVLVLLGPRLRRLPLLCHRSRQAILLSCLRVIKP